VLFVCYFLIVELGRAVESWSGTAAFRVLVAGLGFFVWWLWISIKLPHRDAPWRALVPGAILVAVGLELISILASYVLAPQLENRQGTYGVLGIAAVLLFGLYVISRLLVAGAVVNAAIWDRRGAGTEG